MFFNTQLQPGSVIPYEWYTKFTDRRGNPDLALMSILSEIIYWYRPTKTKDKETGEIFYRNKFKGDTWQTSYSHFQKKFGFNHERVRRIFVKLENMKIIIRELKSVIFNGQIYNNRLFIHLNNDFFTSCFNDNKNSSYGSFSKNCNDTNTKFKETTQKSSVQNIISDSQNNISQNQLQNNTVTVINTVEASPLNKGDIYSNNKTIINKNRSIDSSESESNFVKLENNETHTHIESDDKIKINSPVSTGLSKIKKIFFRNPLKLKDFYPISTQDCSSLRISSKRNFTDIAINEILQNIAIKLDKHEFRSKKAFMNYMSKVLIAEMRDEVKVSGKDFKINANLSPEIRQKKKAEEYLNKLELSCEVSQEMHFKKKLAGVLKPIKAYEVLGAYKFCSTEKTDSGNEKFIMHLSSRVELNKMEKEIILKQAKATHETYEQGEVKFIDKLQIDMPSAFESNYENHVPDKTKEFSGLWGAVCKDLITRYGWDIYNSWFDKLEAKIEDKTKTIKLKAPTKFIRDWIERDYLDVIDKSCSKVGINLTGISTISAG